MQRHLNFLDIAIKVTATADSDALVLMRELISHNPTASLEKASGTISIKKVKKNRIPQRALLKGFWKSSGLSHYVYGATHFWSQGGSLITSDLHALNVKIRLGRKPSPVFITTARNAIKWLIIKAAEKKGYAFAHAAAACFYGQSLLIPGNPGAGKSSFVMRLMKAGAVVVNDDVTLIHPQSGRMIPLALDLHVKGDFSKRFRISTRGRWSWFREEAIREASKINGVDVIFFPQVWAAPESRLKKIPAAEAEKRLNAIYLKETAWNAFPVSSKRMGVTHKKLIKNAKCYVFYCGTDEVKIQSLLERFLKKHAK